MLDKEGEFIRYVDFQERVNFGVNFVDFFGILSGIPDTWRNIIKDNKSSKIDEIYNPFITILKEKVKVTKVFYKILIEKIKEKPTETQKKWQRKLDRNFDTDYWTYIFGLPFRITNDTKLQSFQFKINQRIYFTNSRLMKCKLLDTELCTFCGEAKETIVHLFSECPHVTTLWYNLIYKLENICNIQISKSADTFLFGHELDSHYSDIINLCILITRYYIHICRMKKISPNIKVLIDHLKYYREIEIASLYLFTQAKAQRIRKKWEDINQLFTVVN